MTISNLRLVWGFIGSCALVASLMATSASALTHDGDKIKQAEDEQSVDDSAGDTGENDDSDNADEDGNGDTTKIAPYKKTADGSSGANGIGPDPDGDTNPATNTRAFAKIGDAAEASFDPPYRVVTFEAPPGAHADKIVAQYSDEFGILFSKGLNRQVCEGQRYFRYDSQCTYRAAPSGKFAAVYRNDFHRPLTIEFKKPICVAALAIYPTGGKEGERFEVSLQGYDSAGRKLDPARMAFTWTDYTFRWRNMVGAYFLDNPAVRVDVNVRSFSKKPKKKDESRTGEEIAPEDEEEELVIDRKKIVRFLIDDLAFIDDGCDSELDAIEEAI